MCKPFWKFAAFRVRQEGDFYEGQTDDLVKELLELIDLPKATGQYTSLCSLALPAQQATCVLHKSIHGRTMSALPDKSHFSSRAACEALSSLPDSALLEPPEDPPGTYTFDIWVSIQIRQINLIKQPGGAVAASA
jgi:hypothetical protein